MSIKGSKSALNLSLLFSKVCCFNFLYKAGLPSINVWLITCYANLTSTDPLIGFLKWLEFLEAWFREVVRGLVSPTPFMEGCADGALSRLVLIWVRTSCVITPPWSERGTPHKATCNLSSNNDSTRSESSDSSKFVEIFWYTIFLRNNNCDKHYSDNYLLTKKILEQNWWLYCLFLNK